MNNFNSFFEILFAILFSILFFFAVKTGAVGAIRKETNSKKYWLITTGWLAMAIFEFCLAFFK